MADLLLATAGEDLRLWSMPNLNRYSVKGPPTGNSIRYCTCSNNGQMIAYANEGHGINISSLQSENTTIWDIPTSCEQSSVAFSNSSRFLVSGGKDCIVNMWDIKSRCVRRTFRDQINPVSYCVFNFNDKIVASSSDQGEIVLTDVSSGLASEPLLGVDTQTINCLQYSHFTHNLLASASRSGAVALWDSNDRKLLRTFTEHNLSSTCLSFSPLNDMLLSSTGLDKRIIFYDVCYKKIVKTINTEEPLTCCDFLHDGTTVAVGSVSGHIFLFDLRHGATPLKVIPAHRSAVRSLSFQKLMKEKPSKRQLSQDAKTEKGLSTGSPKHHVNNESTSNVPPSPRTPTKIPRTNATLERQESFQDNNWRLSSGKSLENLQSVQPKYAKTSSNEYFSELETARKPLKRSKSSLKKYDLSPKGGNNSIGGESDTQSMGSRGKSGLSRLSLLSRSTGDISKSGRNNKKDKNSDDISNIIKRCKERESVDATKKGMFKSPFRKKPTDYKSSDDSESSSIESISIDDKIYMRTKKKSQSSNSNDSDSKSTDMKISDISTTITATKSYNRSDSTSMNTDKTINDVVQSTTKESNDTNMSVVTTVSTGVTERIFPDNINTEDLKIEFVQKMIDDAMTDTRFAIHRDMVNMQVEFIRQMEIQKEQLQQLLEHYSINDDMVTEIQRLRTENENLRKRY